MKGVITAAGLGTRSGLDGKFRKEMLPLYDCRDGRTVLRPVLDCIINGMSNSGVREIACVIKPDDLITRTYLSNEFPDVEILYQPAPDGYGNAVLMADSFVSGEDFLLNAGDGFLVDSGEFFRLAVSGKFKNKSVLNIMKVEDPRNYGCPSIEVVGDEIRVLAVDEKPAKPRSDYGLCAVYFLNQDVMDNLREAAKRGGELTPAINKSIQNGNEVTARIIEGKKWLSVGKAKKYVEVLRRSLEESELQGC
ncbi:MAG: sugar phosphate nucleotidyltransferase [Candidatus Thermoplasmatota archaeon]|jgi:glucose-1-phosphate thymidylyltransferase|nr:sugar phosphate nucleotidyltransferase [Candidatus Thermoplasmatota archaeon]